MTKKVRCSFLFLGLLVFPVRTAFAPIFFKVRGIDDLIRRADAIAVMTVRKCLTVGAPERLYKDYEVLVANTLKGDIPEGRLTVSLRRLPLWFTATSDSKRKSPGKDKSVPIRQSFDFGTTHVVFFERPSAKRADIVYRSLNVAGAHILVSGIIRAPLGRPFKGLKGKSAKDAILVLLDGFIATHKADRYAPEREAYKTLIKGRGVDQREPNKPDRPDG